MTERSIDDPELALHDLFELWPDTIAVFLGHGMLCVGCCITLFHTVIDACSAYRLDEGAFRAELRKFIVSNEIHKQDK